MDWRVVDGYIVMTKDERENRIKALLEEYIQLANKLPHRTPDEVLNTLRMKYDEWFRAVESSVIDEFINRLDKRILAMDVDPYWDVSFENQYGASDVFNDFINSMSKLGPKAKSDRSLVTTTMNSIFSDVFNIRDGQDINRALKKDKQLHAVAKRLIKKLSKMGYNF